MFLRQVNKSRNSTLSNIRKFFLLIIFFIGFVGCNYLYAEGQPGVKESTLLDLIKAGGIVGLFIILVSILGGGLVIEHFVNITRDKLCPPEIVAELEALVEEGQYENALTLCTSNPNFFCNIVGAALSKVNVGYEAMVEAMQAAGEDEAAKLNQKISYISLIGSITPMLGLLGTVVGMISAFGIIKTKMSPSPADLAKGVEEALVTTAEGLLVSIPMMTVFFYFKNKVTLYIIQLGIMAGEFVDKFKGVSVEE
jgi:biopolymer transport protein ExbB